MKGNTMVFSGVSVADLASPSLHKLDDNVPSILPISYSSLPHFMAKVDKEWPADLRKAPHLCLYGTFDRYDDVSLFLQAAIIP